jgi:hypothetical protein
MRKLLLLLSIILLMLVCFAVAVGFAIHWAGTLNGMTMSVDGETIEGPAIAALVIGAIVFGVAIACLVAFAVVASVAIVVPIVLIGGVIAMLVAIFVGLAPLTIPVLLGVGAYVLLSRRSKRKEVPQTSTLPSSTSPS